MPISYGEALQYLYSLTNYEIKTAFAYAPQYFDLRRVLRVLEALDNPHLKFRSVHIAGTKGKGSTSAMLASVLTTAGYRTGLYTSPHLHSFRERVQVSGTCIPEADFSAWVERLQPLARLDPELTTFEVATALAFAYFARVKVDLAVIEVGLGGRLDATNVVQPLVSVISAIGHDHMHILGKTLALIAAEKAGIIKQAVPVVSAPQEPGALSVLERVASEKHAPMRLVSRDWTWRSTHHSLDAQQFTINGRGRNGIVNGNGPYKNLQIPLLGKHQMRNAAVALATVEELRSLGLTVTDTAVREGLRDVVWPARFEILGRQPFFVVDGAHNVDSARCVADTLQQYFPGHRPWFVLGILADKDIPAILHHLLPLGQGVFFSRPSHPRAADPAGIQQQAARYGVPGMVIENVGQATQEALRCAGSDGLVVAAGSFTTAGAARETWLRLHNRPLPALDPQA